ncbi:MAG: 3-phosphoshikimate 1-carboxyvinyltransferase [Planctomycetaceae bacterium]|jgi:3-phosphoshikimate 1-carboxyvinyltransferase|nr:3-phosphoshikimate 1-carboxyvinyltransferase [Planctomycetaceae bacterium]
MPIDLVLSPPSSQSIAKRALICAAIANGNTLLKGSFLSQDLQVMVDSLRRIGLRIKQDSKHGKIEILGQGGFFPVDEEYIDVDNSVLTANFLTALLAFSSGIYRINGDKRVQQYPMGDLIFALNQLGADVRSESAYNTLPLLIEGIIGREGISPSSKRYGINAAMNNTDLRYAALTGTATYLYASAILLASPLAALNSQVELHFVNQLCCHPYILMTLDVMREFGVDVPIRLHSDDTLLFSKGTTYIIPRGIQYRPHEYRIESDAALANYAFAAAAIAGGSVTVRNLSDKSIQKELEFVYCMQRMGCRIEYVDQSVRVTRQDPGLLRGISVDMEDLTDSIQTFAVCALFATSPSRVTNISQIRHCEPGRIEKLCVELRKFGAKINEFEDGFLIVPPEEIIPATIEADGDPRLVMSLGLIGLRVKGVQIDSADCVKRSWSNFFNEIGLDF